MQNKSILFFSLIFTFVLITSCINIDPLLNEISNEYALEKNTIYKNIWNLDNINIVESDYQPTIIYSTSAFFVHATKEIQIPYILAIDSSSGEKIWEKKFNVLGDIGDITASANNIFFASGIPPKIAALNLKNGELQWEKQLTFSKKTNYFNIINKKININTADQNFYILDLNGEIILDRTFESQMVFFKQDNIIYRMEKHSIVAFNEVLSKNEWEIDLGEAIIHSPVIEGDTIYLKTGIYPLNAYSINLITGTVNWEKQGDVVSNLCLMDNQIFYLNYEGYLIEINKISGEEISRVKLNQSLDTSREDYIIAGDVENNILAIGFGKKNQIMGLKILNP